jgi:hypothetical protein
MFRLPSDYPARYLSRSPAIACPTRYGSFATSAGIGFFTVEDGSVVQTLAG